MFVLGIVGGVASKSFIATALQSRGALVLWADQIGHAVLREPEVITAFRDRWSDKVLDADGQIIRAQVAAKVFGNLPAALAERAFLEQMTHPRIRARLETQLAHERTAGTKLLVLDAALLFETQWHLLCNGVLFVDTPRDLRLARAVARGWTANEFAAREQSQWSVEAKRRQATWVLDNSGSIAETTARVEQFYQQTLLPLLAS